MDNCTTDTFFNGRIRIKQRKSGYRFAIDAVLLAHHARPGTGGRVLDLGTGCGIIALILAYRYDDLDIFGIEVQKDLAALARENVEANAMAKCIRILCQDMKSLKPKKLGGPVDLVVCNPPYRKTAAGRINPDHQRAVAKHEIRATLKDVVTAASCLLHVAGRFLIIYPAERATDIFIEMRSADIEPKAMRVIHPDGNSDSKRILVEGVKEGRPGLRIGPPLIIYRNKDYTDEVAAMFRP